MTYEEHVLALSLRHEIVLHRDDHYEPQADVNGREVWIAESLDDDHNYLTALHEIGHIVAEVWAPKLLCEWAAWEWAYEVALPVSPEALVRTWNECLGTYFDDDDDDDDDDALSPEEMRGKRC